MQRRLVDYIIISLKGMAMGAADAVPGVSGGTIAFISGIYQELIESISNINLALFKTFKNDGFIAFWKQANGNFVLALMLGIVVSFITFMRLANYLLEHHPILIWSFFFGLIIASIFFVGKQIKKWSLITIIAVIFGAASAFYITTLPSLASNSSPWFLGVAGAIAICAMILPGISGSFILVILGAYKTLSDAFNDFDVKRIAIFATGAFIGLLSFSKVLKWLFKHHENTTLALLTGFIFGSLNKVWPWKQTDTILNEATGQTVPFSNISTLGNLTIHQQQINDFDGFKTVLEHSISPANYSLLNNTTTQISLAIALMIFGFLTIFILEKLGNKQS
jgi:putative membrane protein